jgi:glycerophosphoryl diester phosphodiesterase
MNVERCRLSNIISRPSPKAWPYPGILAHRGGGVLAPENTLAALRCGLAHGFHAVEFDVMLTSDQVPVLMHDPDFGRTVPGAGNVAGSNANDLLQMDAGAWFGPQFRGEPVPSLAQAMAFCRLHQIWMNIEIKPAPGHEEPTGRIVAQLVQDYFGGPGLPADAADASWPLLSSFSDVALLAAKAAAPAIRRAYLVDAIPHDWQGQLVRLGALALHTNQKNLTPALAHAVKQAGYGLFCYTVNDPARAREITGWGVDGFCTDRIDLIGPDFV